MAKPKNGVNKFDDRLAILWHEKSKKKYQDMCTAIGVDMSEHIREKLETEIALYEDAQR